MVAGLRLVAGSLAKRTRTTKRSIADTRSRGRRRRKCDHARRAWPADRLSHCLTVGRLFSLARSQSALTARLSTLRALERPRVIRRSNRSWFPDSAPSPIPQTPSPPPGKPGEDEGKDRGRAACARARQPPTTHEEA
ncbi:unnamed protein product, partial [Scytosiphon promiscuus]